MIKIVSKNIQLHYLFMYSCTPALGLACEFRRHWTNDHGRMFLASGHLYILQEGIILQLVSKRDPRDKRNRLHQRGSLALRTQLVRTALALPICTCGVSSAGPRSRLPMLPCCASIHAGKAVSFLTRDVLHQCLGNR